MSLASYGARGVMALVSHRLIWWPFFLTAICAVVPGDYILLQSQSSLNLSDDEVPFSRFRAHSVVLFRHGPWLVHFF